MKNIFLSITACAIASAAPAQITITQNDLAPLYTQMRQAIDTMPTVNEGSAGASQTWNFATLPTHRVDTITFTLPQFTPYGGTFPGANLAADNNIDGTQSFIYLNSASSGIEINGQASDPFGTGVIAFPFSNTETLITFPSTYNTAFTDTASGVLQMYYGQDPGIGFTVDSFRVHSTVMKNSVMDAWGSVTTPAGTYNALRQNVKRLQYDTIDIYAFGNWFYEYYTQMDSNRVYSYWANSVGFPVAELTDEQETGTITQAWWLQSTALVGIPENNNAASASLYPNPASDNITFVSAGTNAVFITIYDMNGQLVEKQSVTGDRAGLNVSSYAAGMYFYQASDANGNVVSRGKFNVAH